MGGPICGRALYWDGMGGQALYKHKFVRILCIMHQTTNPMYTWYILFFLFHHSNKNLNSHYSLFLTILHLFPILTLGNQVFSSTFQSKGVEPIITNQSFAKETKSIGFVIGIGNYLSLLFPKKIFQSFVANTDFIIPFPKA